MVKPEYQDLVRLIHDRAGNTFRSAFSYTADDWQALYLRDDIATKELHDVLPQLIDRARTIEPIVREEEYPKIGAAQASVELHEHGVLIHFRESKDEGVAVSLEREAARELATFIDSCTELL
ncbi:hypothetical protein [Halopiger aswanensis]|uniref:Uncharacterized protein n=1 Tax=Halopiger aswanensis TaxID=148449 RepID=A0A3R7GER5_9EURY|nr:hypothetical protein [Halopiger aswanensis]RKD85909.1 hypothetical protein ATJ93_4679 [Halopiger aswanensis]